MSIAAAVSRVCSRCRTDRVAGSMPWSATELVCRGVGIIVGGAPATGTEAHVGARVGLSGRHLRRLFLEHVGVTPQQFARFRRTQSALRLLEDTGLTVVDVAFAAGFGSLRQFNRTIRDVFGASPNELRRRRTDRVAADGSLDLRLAVNPSDDRDSVRGLLAARTILIDGEPGLLEVEPDGPDHLLLRARLPHWDGIVHVVAGVRRMLGARVP